MHRLLAVVAMLLAGCQLVFKLEEPPPVLCTTKARALVDGLTTDTPFWDESTTNPVTYDTGGVHLVMDSAESSFTRQNVFYDLRQSSFSVEVDPDVMLGTGDLIAFSLLAPDFDFANNTGHVVEILRRNGKLIASYFENGDQNEIDMLDFDPAVHQRWQISRRGDTTSWAVGPVDGEPVVIQTFDLPWATFLAPQLGSFRSDAANPPFTTTFRNLNGGAEAEPEEVCGGEQLIDTFDATDIDRDTWGRSGTAFEVGCTFGIDGGDLAVTFETAGAARDVCSMGSSGVYDLISHTFTIEVDAVLPSSEIIVVQVEMPGVNTANFRLQNGKLSAVTEVDGVDTPARTADYDPTAHRFWRFAGSIGDDGRDQLEWQVSATGKPDDFAFFASAGTVDKLDRVRFTLSIAGDGNESPETRVRFPRVN